jgi:DNA-binding CsgD family transcriptional regulator
MEPAATLRVGNWQVGTVTVCGTSAVRTVLAETVPPGTAVAAPHAEVAVVLLLTRSQRPPDDPGLSPATLQALMQSVRVTVSQQTFHAGPDLSGREREVMDHLVRGRTNAEIALALFIAEKTVKNHLASIYTKLQARGRAEAIARWLGTDGGTLVHPRPGRVPRRRRTAAA